MGSIRAPGSNPHLPLTPAKPSIVLPDLLIEIFAYVLHRPLDRDCKEVPFQFVAALVCHQWRDTVFGTPALWTNVYLSPLSTFNIGRYLQRSKAALIKLVIAFPDSTPSSQFLEKLQLLLPPHLPRIRELHINHCDCLTKDVFATIGIFSSFPMTNLVAFEIHEIHDLYSYYYTRAITRAIPKAGLPWGRNLHRLCVPGCWLHMAIVGPRPVLTTLEIDNRTLSRKSFKAMVENMPALTSLIFHDQHNVYGGLSDVKASQVKMIDIPSLRLFRMHDYDHRQTNSEGTCNCLLKPLVAPNLEILEICSEYRQEINPDDPSEWDTFLFSDSRIEPDEFPTTCIFDHVSLRHWNGPSSRLHKVRIENVPAPHRLLRLLDKPVHIEYVYNHNCHTPEDLMLLPFEMPTTATSLSLDLAAVGLEYDRDLGVAKPELNAIPVIQELIGLAGNGTSPLTCPVTIHLAPGTIIPELESGALPKPLSVVYTPTIASSQSLRTGDDLGYFARRNYWMNRGSPDGSFKHFYPHKFTSKPQQSLRVGMEVPYTDEFADSDDDSIWSV